MTPRDIVSCLEFFHAQFKETAVNKLRDFLRTKKAQVSPWAFG